MDVRYLVTERDYLWNYFLNVRKKIYLLSETVESQWMETEEVVFEKEGVVLERQEKHPITWAQS